MRKFLLCFGHRGTALEPPTLGGGFFPGARGAAHIQPPVAVKTLRSSSGGGPEGAPWTAQVGQSGPRDTGGSDGAGAGLQTSRHRHNTDTLLH